MTEVWKASPTAPSYEVSNLGRVRHAETKRVRRPHIGNRHGYALISVRFVGKDKTLKVHRLVCEAFHGPPPEGKNDVAHGDGDRTNNNADNLRWASRSENMRDMVRHGNERPYRGSQNVNAILTEDAVREIRAAPKRRGILYELAEKFGVSRNVVGNIRSNRKGYWPHVN